MRQPRNHQRLPRAHQRARHRTFRNGRERRRIPAPNIFGQRCRDCSLDFVRIQLHGSENDGNSQPAKD
jgi:hypothetical protein